MGSVIGLSSTTKSGMGLAGLFWRHLITACKRGLLTSLDDVIKSDFARRMREL